MHNLLLGVFSRVLFSVDKGRQLSLVFELAFSAEDLAFKQAGKNVCECKLAGCLKY